MLGLLLLLLCFLEDEDDFVFFNLDRSLLEGMRLLGRDFLLLSFL